MSAHCYLLTMNFFQLPSKKKQLNWKIYKWLTIKAETLWIKMIVCGQKFPSENLGHKHKPTYTKNKPTPKSFIPFHPMAI